MYATWCCGALSRRYKEMELLAQEFLQTSASRLNFFLYLKSWWAPNYGVCMCVYVCLRGGAKCDDAMVATLTRPHLFLTRTCNLCDS